MPVVVSPEFNLISEPVTFKDGSVTLPTVNTEDVEFATIVGALPKALAWLAVTDPLPDKVTEPVNVLEPDKVTVPDPLAVIPPVPEITPDKV